MTSSSHNGFQMFSDGDTLAIIDGCTTHVFTEALLKEVNMARQQSWILHEQISEINIQRFPGAKHLDIDISFSSCNCVTIPTSEFNFGEKILSKYSARDLIKIIKKKIDDRSQDSKK